MTKIAQNRNIPPLHGRWISTVRRHPVGPSLEVTSSLSRPARHYSVGIAQDPFTKIGGKAPQALRFFRGHDLVDEGSRDHSGVMGIDEPSHVVQKSFPVWFRQGQD